MAALQTGCFICPEAASDVFDGIPAELEISIVGAVAAQDWCRYDEEVLGPICSCQPPTTNYQLPSVAKHAWAS